MSALADSIRSALDAPDGDRTISNAYQPQPATQQTHLPTDASVHASGQTQQPVHNSLNYASSEQTHSRDSSYSSPPSENTYTYNAMDSQREPYTQSGAQYEVVPRQHTNATDNYSKVHTQYPQSEVSSSSGLVNDSYATSAGPPVYSHTTSSTDFPVNGTTYTTIETTPNRPLTMTENAAEKAKIMVANAAASANIIASHAMDSVHVAVANTADKAKVHIMANPTVQHTTEQLREEFEVDSHDMATKNYGLQGAVQTHAFNTNNGVRDLGWHRPTMEIPDPLIGGLSNANLFSLIRRFNKDVLDVRAVPLVRELDLNEAWSNKHATDKTTAHLQRMYISVILSLISFGKHMARLRSWKETQRTGIFCAVYVVAWSLDLLMPALLGLLIAVVSSKETRDKLFPPAPLALVNISTGGLQKPQAGQLGSVNTLTGAPEKHEGEAVEEEAADFIDNIRHLVGKAIGMHEKPETEGDPLESKIPKPIRNAAKAIKSAGSAPGHVTENTDRTQEPMEEILWEQANPEKIEKVMKVAPHVVGELVDNWERIANALAPTAPFNKSSFLRFDALLVPAFLGSLVVNYYMVYKVIGLAIGFGIFGAPVISPSYQWLNQKYPNWVDNVQPKNNLLRGIPTNRQLALTLLRIGEANNAPLPPVPTSNPDDPDHKQFIDVEDIPLAATDFEKIAAIEPSSMEKSIPQPSEDEADEEDDAPKGKKLSKFVSLFKRNAKGVVKTKFAADHVKAKMGSEKAKEKLGVMPKKVDIVYAGPSEYRARYDGVKGWLYVTSDFLLFSDREQGDRSSPTLRLPIKDILQLTKAKASTGKATQVVAKWGVDRELLPSLDIDDITGKTYKFTGLPERDELFNRLIAIGAHQWESI